jgi:tRNA(adenine34) deaminase
MKMTKTFESAVSRQIEKLQSGALCEVESGVCEKRRRWIEEREHRLDGERITPRWAYELFFREYLGLDLDEVPIVSETTDRLVWRSLNPCPTLDACIALGLDTRRICRAVYEKSTQAFFSALDPSLRFHRSYVEIRPHAPHCGEWLVRVNFEAAMKMAIEEARTSRAEGNKGYGAVVLSLRPQT